MPIIHFVREDKRIEVSKGENLRKLCRQQGIQIYPLHARLLNCRGNGLCGTCLVRIDEPDALSPPTRREALKMGALLDPRFRLSCQAEVQGDFRCLTQTEPPQGWHSHPAYRRMEDSDPFEGLSTLAQEIQAEQQEQGLEELSEPKSPEDEAEAG